MIHILCFFGIHLRGIRTAGCLHNISKCAICKRDVWHVMTEVDAA